MVSLDTNLLVRLLTNDDPEQAALVEHWLEENTRVTEPAWVDAVVLAETAWVLKALYGYDRATLAGALEALLGQPRLNLESPLAVYAALKQFRAGPADFADYYIAARSKANGFAPVLTFDLAAAKSKTHRLLKEYSISKSVMTRS